MSALRWMMPIHFVVAMSISWAHAEPVAEPYRVYIAAGGAPVYSGPGDDYYATQKLPESTECEVYEELRAGWLAIRPPAGSYSLVLRSALGDLEGDVATVTRDGTPSRVGSVLVDKFSSVHVRLDKGEEVQVIDVDTGDSSQWVTIAPPAGEFRWIREADVVLSPVPSHPKDRSEPLATPPDDRGDASTWRHRPDDQAVASGKEPIIRITTHEDVTPNESKLSTAADSGGVERDANAFPNTPKTFAEHLDQLEIDLSRRVSGPVNLWLFDDLEQRAAQLLSSARTPDEEQLVQALARRLTRFASIGERYRTSRTKADHSIDSIASRANTAVTPDPALAQYDAVGVLRPVVSKQGNAPPYALVDDAGNIVTFITPSPLLNLQQHLGRRVGVSGTRGFLPEYRSRNIQTARVAPLDAAVLR